MEELARKLLDQVQAPVVDIVCVRCSKRVQVSTAMLRKKFGNQRMDIVARMVARTSANGACALAEDPFEPLCSARPLDADPVDWALLVHAEKGGWRAFLHCHRRHAGLKRTESCPEVPELPIVALKAVFGWQLPLEQLPRRLRCPYCETSLISIEWRIPARAPDPGGATEEAPALQLRPMKAALGRRRFRVIE